MVDEQEIEKLAFFSTGVRTALQSIRSAWERLARSRLDPLTRKDIGSKLEDAAELLKKGQAGEARNVAEEAIMFIESAW